MPRVELLTMASVRLHELNPYQSFPPPQVAQWRKQGPFFDQKLAFCNFWPKIEAIKDLKGKLILEKPDHFAPDLNFP